MSVNKICHVEYQVTDMARGKEFYGGLFEWKFEDMGTEYSLFSTPDAFLGGGLQKSEKVNSGDSPLVYVAVANIEETLARAETLGGATALARTPIPGHGDFAILTDPDGNRVGIYQGSGG
jgi:uncharacterized protein